MLILLVKFSMASSIIKFIILLVVFFGLLFGASWVAKWYANTGTLKRQQGNIQLVESYAIGQGKVLQIVKVGTRYILLGQGKDAIVYLTELSESDLCFAREKDKDSAGFQEVLLELFKKKEKQQHTKDRDES